MAATLSFMFSAVSSAAATIYSRNLNKYLGIKYSGVFLTQKPTLDVKFVPAVTSSILI